MTGSLTFKITFLTNHTKSRWQIFKVHILPSDICKRAHRGKREEQHKLQSHTLFKTHLAHSSENSTLNSDGISLLTRGKEHEQKKLLLDVESFTGKIQATDVIQH